MRRGNETGAGLTDLLVGSLILAILSAASFPVLLGLYQNGWELSKVSQGSSRSLALRLFLDNWVSRAGSSDQGVTLTPLSWITVPGVSGAVGVQLQWEPFATDTLCTARLEQVRLTVAQMPVSGLLWQSTAPTASTASVAALCRPGSAFLPLPTQNPSPYPWRFSLVTAPGCSGGKALAFSSAAAAPTASTEVLACLPNL